MVYKYSHTLYKWCITWMPRGARHRAEQREAQRRRERGALPRREPGEAASEVEVVQVLRVREPRGRARVVAPGIALHLPPANVDGGSTNESCDLY